jgi:hypothetical protein
MQKIFSADILDIFPCETGFIYACREFDGSGDTAGFFTYDITADIFERISIRDYIAEKFGGEGFELAKNLGDFVTCTLRGLSPTSNIASYNDGTIKIFDNYGFISDTKKVKYLNYPARSPEPYGRDLWMAVPEANAVINYSLKYDRIEFRIGGPKESAFSHPASLSLYDGCLYVCNENSFSIKTIDLDTYKVSGFYVFNEPVSRYFKAGKSEFVLLKSGLYKL